MEKPRDRSVADFLSCRLLSAESTCRANDQLPIGEGFCFRLSPERVFRSVVWFEGEDALLATLRHFSPGNTFLPDRCRTSDCVAGKRAHRDRGARNCKCPLLAEESSRPRDPTTFVVRQSNRSELANQKAARGRARCSPRRSRQID